MSHPNRNRVKNWPKYLTEYRSIHKLTQCELADLLQIACRTVQNWEAGINTPPEYLKKALLHIEGEK